MAPVLALFLFMVPLLGHQQFGEGMASLLVYFFAVWAAIIALTAVIARALRRQEGEEQREDDTP